MVRVEDRVSVKTSQQDGNLTFPSVSFSNTYKNDEYKDNSFHITVVTTFGQFFKLRLYYDEEIESKAPEGDDDHLVRQFNNWEVIYYKNYVT